jgi:uncharacterized Zn-binding protein involved in type VI secretion
MNKRKAARNNDGHHCNWVRPGPVLHVGGPITCPSGRTVEIDSRLASTYGDEAECTGVASSPPPKDTIIGGYLKVFINGNPAARIEEKTYGDKVTEGSDDIFYGDKVDKLAEAAANWLHQYLAKQEHIPFDHPWDGCYARAHEMKRIMETQFNVELKKIFVYGDLKPDPIAPINPVFWGYHVAPLVEGIDASGNPIQYVIDPSLSPDRVPTQSEWLNLSRGSSGRIDHYEITSSDQYGPRPTSTDNGYTNTRSVLDQKNSRRRRGQRRTPTPPPTDQVALKRSYPPPTIRPPHVA